MAHNIQSGQESAKIEMTPEEERVLRKCMSDSLWTHTCPSVAGTAIVMQLLRTKGYSLNRWTGGFVLLSSAIASRVAAMPGCIKLCMKEVPDGTLANKVEEMKLAKQAAQGGIDTGFAPDDRRGGKEPGFAADLEIERVHDDPSMQDFNTRLTPQEAYPTAPSASSQTYDDLRRRNRDQYFSKKTAQSPPPAPPPQDQSPSSSLYSSILEPSSPYYDPSSSYSDSSVTPDEEPKVRRRRRVNQYGDPIED